jgi:hypothetical protein
MQSNATGRTCPKCGSDDYTFRHRMQKEADSEKGDLPTEEIKHPLQGVRSSSGGGNASRNRVVRIRELEA